MLPAISTLHIAAAMTLPMTHQSDTASCLTPTVTVTAVTTVHFVASLIRSSADGGGRFRVFL